jgi:hypothetical protein
MAAPRATSCLYWHRLFEHFTYGVAQYVAHAKRGHEYKNVPHNHTGGTPHKHLPSATTHSAKIVTNVINICNGRYTSYVLGEFLRGVLM